MGTVKTSPKGKAAPPAGKPWQSAEDLQQRLAAEVTRSIDRNLKSLHLLGARAPEVGLTPKSVLYRKGTLSLYHYKAQVDEVYRIPLLLVMAPTNKAYIFDLAPGQSLVEFLLKQGYDVYVIDWNAPTQDERHLKLEDYVLDFIPECVRRVQEDSGEQDINLIGYCMGGLLTSMYLALHPDSPVRNVVFFTTPIDFEHMELWRHMGDEKRFDVDRMVESTGVIPADVVRNSFDMLRPTSLLAGRARLWDKMWNDEFVTGFRRMERWGNETLPVPGGYFAQLTKEMLRKNALVKGELRLGGKPVDLGRITQPMLHVIAEYDHIVPPLAAKPLFEQVGSTDKEEMVLPGGHVSLVAGPNAVKRMWPKLNEWLERRST